MSLLERIISSVSPQTALHRQLARQSSTMINRWNQSQWDVSNPSRGRQQGAWGRAKPGSEDSTFTWHDRETAILECRDLYRNSEIAGSIVDRLADYVIWDGIWAQPVTESKDWNVLAQDWFNEHFCVYRWDYKGREEMSIVDLQRWMEIAEWTDGGMGIHFLKNGQLQVIDYERIQTPKRHADDENVRHGVQYNRLGKISGFYVCARDKRGAIDKENYEYVPRENMAHVHAPFPRSDQSVAMPGLSRLASKLRDIDETDMYTLLKVKHDSMLLLKENREGGRPGSGLPSPFAAQQAGTPTEKRINKHEWGMTWSGTENEDLNAFGGMTPTAQYVPYLKMQLEMLAPGIGIPYEYLMLAFTQGSYTAQRSASIHARNFFMRRYNRKAAVMQRIWNWRIARAIKDGELPPAPVEAGTGRSQWSWTNWTKPGYTWLNPKEEATANQMLWNGGQRGMKSLIADTGADRDEVFAEKTSDIQQAQKMADEANKANPALHLTWRDIIETRVPGQIPSEREPNRKARGDEDET